MRKDYLTYEMSPSEEVQMYWSFLQLRYYKCCNELENTDGKSYTQSPNQNCKVFGNQKWASNKSHFAILEVTHNVIPLVKRYPNCIFNAGLILWNQTPSGKKKCYLQMSHTKCFGQKHWFFSWFWDKIEF